MSKSYPILWPSLQKVEQLYRASSSQSQIFCKFKSTATDKFLNLKKPTLRNTDGTIFEITSIGWVLVNGEYLKVNTVDSNGDVDFKTSAEPDVQWDGNHLISRKKNKALDIYDIDTNNVKLWTYNGHENQKWLQVNIATTLQLNTDAIEYTIIDKTGQYASFFPISKPTSLVYRGEELIIDNYIFFSGHALLHNTEPKIRMPALLMTESTFQQIVMNPNMTHDGAFGSDFKKIFLKTLISGQVGGTFDISLSATNWRVVWKFPSDMFQIPIWTRDVRSEFALPVGYYPLYQDFGPIVQSQTQMPLDSLVLKMRQKVSGIDLHTLKHLSEATIPMLSYNYFFQEMWSTPTQEEQTNVANVCIEMKKRNIHVFPCHSQHHAAIVFYTHNSNLVTCEMLSHWLSDETFVFILQKALLPGMLPSFKHWVETWKMKYTAKVSNSTEISVLTYNCLYTEYAHDPPNISGFETELIGKTSAYGSKKVKKTNLGWHVRKRKIINNILKHGKPDILLLQETTPHMCADILSFFPGFRAVHSEFGNLGGIVSDGYCYVLFDTSKFELTKEMSETIQHGLRFIGLILFHKESQKDVFVASLHLPASGTAPVGSIKTIINKLKIPVILGGDFNVTYNPFSNLQNLTGNEPTFYNDDTYKLDWIVGKNVVYKHHTLNEIVEDEGRWPNAEEGSDHTAIFVTLLLK